MVAGCRLTWRRSSNRSASQCRTSQTFPWTGRRTIRANMSARSTIPISRWPWTSKSPPRLTLLRLASLQSYAFIGRQMPITGRSQRRFVLQRQTVAMCVRSHGDRTKPTGRSGLRFRAGISSPTLRSGRSGHQCRYGGARFSGG